MARVSAGMTVPPAPPPAGTARVLLRLVQQDGRSGPDGGQLDEAGTHLVMLHDLVHRVGHALAPGRLGQLPSSSSTLPLSPQRLDALGEAERLKEPHDVLGMIGRPPGCPTGACSSVGTGEKKSLEVPWEIGLFLVVPPQVGRTHLRGHR